MNIMHSNHCLLSLFSIQNTNQQKRLLSEAILIGSATTVQDIALASDKGVVRIFNLGTGLAPSYGRGVILYSAKDAFKALLVDDDTNNLYLWSCHKQKATDIIAKVVSVIKIG